MHAIVLGYLEKFLDRVVLGVVDVAVLDTHEVVDDVEVVVDYVAARHDVLVVEVA